MKWADRQRIAQNRQNYTAIVLDAEDERKYMDDAARCLTAIAEIKEMIQDRDNLRLMFFAKMDFGDDHNAYNGQHWVDRYLLDHTDLVTGGQTTGGYVLRYAVSGRFMHLYEGALAFLPLDCIRERPELGWYVWVCDTIEKWLQANMKQLKRILADNGGTQMELF